MPFANALRFPFSRVLLPPTRLAYIHLRNLLTDAKRDRAARISGYVAISLPDELVILYLLRGEVANATVRDARGARALAIASAIDKVPLEPEYGEIYFHEADVEQLACMYAAEATAPEPWPEGMTAQDPAALFPYLMSTTFDGVVEIIANEFVNYLIFKNGGVARAFLASAHHGTVVDRVAKLFAREGRIGELVVSRWGVPVPLPVQAPPALVQAYRELTATLVQKLVDQGRESAPAIAEHARQNLLAAHPVLEGFSYSGRPTQEPLADTAELTGAVAAWIRDVMFAAVDPDALSPDAFLREITWDRRHIFQSAGLFDQIPWKVM
ncbi:MAG TPA: hypothetical protein VF785_01285 [Gemmatimonadaceae bacterium]|nr:hypothetical protein [Acidimicrobiia bacterium]